MYFGEKGYVETTKKIISTARYIKKEWVLFFANYNSVAYLKNLFEKGIECDILKASFSSLAYQIEFYILSRINVSLKCSRLPVFIAVIDLQQYLTEQVICFNFQSVYTGVMITLFD